MMVTINLRWAGNHPLITRYGLGADQCPDNEVWTKILPSDTPVLHLHPYHGDSLLFIPVWVGHYEASHWLNPQVSA